MFLILKSTAQRIRKWIKAMAFSKPLPEFVLFGDSLTEWSFGEETQGFGLFFEKKYAGKVNIVNEGTVSSNYDVVMTNFLYSLL